MPLVNAVVGKVPNRGPERSVPSKMLLLAVFLCSAIATWAQGNSFRQGALQRRVCRFKTGGILLQGDKDNYCAILVSLQGVTGVPVSVAEKDREFVPLSVGAEVTKGEEGKDAKEKTAENKPTQNSPAEPTKGTVNVSSNPTGADVLVDAEFVGLSETRLRH